MSQIPEISVESTDLLTEIAVSYYQDGATQEEISKNTPFHALKWGGCSSKPVMRGLLKLL